MASAATCFGYQLAWLQSGMAKPRHPSHEQGGSLCVICGSCCFSSL